MGRLVYTAITSLDGYVADDDGRFDWAAPDEQVLAFVNDLERPVGTYLYGRQMYETMRFWETADGAAEQSAAVADYTRIWQAADKVVYSRTLGEVASVRTRIERDFVPGEVRALKAATARDLSIGGPRLAAVAFAAGLIDECRLLVTPVVVGGGNPALPAGIRVQFDLLDVRRFGSGVVHLHYRVRA